MQLSHSRVETFEKCPRQFQLRYISGLKTIPDDAPDNALHLGTAMHTGLETGDVQKAIDQYYSNFPVITDAHVNEAIKLETMINKSLQLIPEGMFEVPLRDPDFIGFIDLLEFTECIGGINHFNLYDFKYSNNLNTYLNSDQLHLYKFFFERLHPDCVIDQLFYLMIPKSKVKWKSGQDVQEYRKELIEDLKLLDPELVHVEYDQTKVIRFLLQSKRMLEAKNYDKKEGFLCKYCEFCDYCKKGIDYMLLPKNERRSMTKTNKKVLWIYGAPFSGKTTFANAFPDPIMLNTDGNIKFVDSPYVSIRDEVHKEGRQTVRTMAWEIFKDAIAELEIKENTFKTIVVDLLEDTYEYCRLYMYDKLGITHESDDSFRAWDKVRTEYLSTIKRLINLDYENIILISHLDATKDITKKGGDKLSTIKPNIQDKIANKISGMVDIVARTIADDGEYMMNFKRSEVIFGGGRLAFNAEEIPLDYERFCKLYDDATGDFAKVEKQDTEPVKIAEEAPDDSTEAEVSNLDTSASNEAPAEVEKTEEVTVRRRRRRE